MYITYMQWNAPFYWDRPTSVYLHKGKDVICTLATWQSLSVSHLLHPLNYIDFQHNTIYY